MLFNWLFRTETTTFEELLRMVERFDDVFLIDLDFEYEHVSVAAHIRELQAVLSCLAHVDDAFDVSTFNAFIKYLDEIFLNSVA